MDTAPTPGTVEEALHQMSDSAGVIFVGEVTAIRWHEGENGASGVVEVSFRVDEAVRGCSAGATYTLNEWAGLWAGGDPRYRVGQRLLMMLHAPGAAGVSSPVGGMAGAIPLRGATAAPQTAVESPAQASVARASSVQASAAPESAAQASEIADLRWVGTRLLRTSPTPSSPMVTGMAKAVADSDIATPGDSSIASQQASVKAVINMLRSWRQGEP
ncbi:MAG TPA: hypothetical protein VIM60_03795 [Edaphobacter sp.]